MIVHLSMVRNTVNDVATRVNFFILDRYVLKEFYFARFVGAQSPAFTIFKKITKNSTSLPVRTAINNPHNRGVL